MLATARIGRIHQICKRWTTFSFGCPSSCCHGDPRPKTDKCFVQPRQPQSVRGRYPPWIMLVENFKKCPPRLRLLRQERYVPKAFWIHALVKNPQWPAKETTHERHSVWASCEQDFIKHMQKRIVPSTVYYKRDCWPQERHVAVVLFGSDAEKRRIFDASW